MSHDRPARGVFMALLCVAIMVFTSGCRRSPFQRPAEGSVPGPKTAIDAAKPETAMAKDSPTVARLPAVSPVSKAALPAEVSRETDVPIQSQAMIIEDDAPFASTPLLDAALKRAEAIETAQRDARNPIEPVRPRDDAMVREVSVVASSAEPHAILVSDLGFHARGTLPAAGQPVVQAAPKPAAPPEPSDPGVVWRTNLERLRQVASDSAGKPGATDAATLWQMRARMVEWLSTTGVGSAGSPLLTAAVATLADAMSVPKGAPASRSDEIRSAVVALEDRAPLVIAELRLCKRVQGFGAFEPIDAQGLKTGQPVLIYCELNGLRYRREGDDFVSRLSSKVELVSAAGDAKVWEATLGEAEDRCRRRRRDYYVNYRINLPTTLTPGDYRVRLTQTDLIAERSTNFEVPVTINR